MRDGEYLLGTFTKTNRLTIGQVAESDLELVQAKAFLEDTRGTGCHHTPNGVDYAAENEVDKNVLLDQEP